jgi:hypothetical protein
MSTCEVRRSESAEAPFRLYRDFFPQAEELRASFDRHFSDPYSENVHLREVWEYWFVPEMYTLLRADPKRVLDLGLLDRFYRDLQAFAIKHLGLAQVSPPQLSFYVNGCGQNLHNDAENGRWAYVYSLTRWDDRRFTGGETQIFHDRDYWETARVATAQAGNSFYSLVPAKFNQLLVFDDRIIHGVHRLQGTMVPADGRIVLNGHITEGGFSVQGALCGEQVASTLAATALTGWIAEYRGTHDGMASVRLLVRDDGAIDRVLVLTQRIRAVRQNACAPNLIMDRIIERLQKIQFPPAAGPSKVTIPFTVPR